jgi:hypothetical protein
MDNPYVSAILTCACIHVWPPALLALMHLQHHSPTVAASVAKNGTGELWMCHGDCCFSTRAAANANTSAAAAAAMRRHNEQDTGGLLCGEPLKRITVSFNSYSYVVALGGGMVYIVKKQPEE